MNNLVKAPSLPPGRPPRFLGVIFVRPTECDRADRFPIWRHVERCSNCFGVLEHPEEEHPQPLMVRRELHSMLRLRLQVQFVPCRSRRIDSHMRQGPPTR